MAPKRKASTETTTTTTTRVTRSSTRRANIPTPPVADPEPPKRKKAKTTPIPDKQEQDTVTDGPKKSLEGSRTIVIEHCKQCTQFKKRAVLVKEGLEKSVEGVNVVVNPEKPRRGCFEVREEGAEIFVSLLDMKRPFGPMKALDMDKVISDIVDKIK